VADAHVVAAPSTARRTMRQMLHSHIVHTTLILVAVFVLVIYLLFRFARR
jgi:hypothetical protein